MQQSKSKYVRWNNTVFAVGLVLAGCATGPKDRGDGAATGFPATPAGVCNQIVPVDATTQAQAVQFVFEYVRKNYPGAKIRNKLLRGEETPDGKKLYDVYELRLLDGGEDTVCFDISATISGYSRPAS